MPDHDMFSYMLGLKKVLRILWVKRSKYSEHKDQDMRQARRSHSIKIDIGKSFDKSIKID